MDVLQAAQRFLLSLAASAGEEQVSAARQQQYLNLQLHLQRTAASTEEGADLLRELQASSVWSAQQQEDLAGLVHAAVARGLGAAPGGEPAASKFQNFESLPRYLPQRLWDSLQDEKVSLPVRLSQLCDFATRLGLRNPTESTSQALTAIAMFLPGAGSYATPRAQHECFCCVKDYLRRACLSAPRELNLPWVPVLPLSPQQHDRRWKDRAYERGEQPATDPPVDFNLLTGVMRAIPMRSSRKSLQPTSRAGLPELFQGDSAGQCLKVILAKLMESQDAMPGFQLLKPLGAKDRLQADSGLSTLLDRRNSVQSEAQLTLQKALQNAPAAVKQEPALQSVYVKVEKENLPAEPALQLAAPQDSAADLLSAADTLTAELGASKKKQEQEDKFSGKNPSKKSKQNQCTAGSRPVATPLQCLRRVRSKSNVRGFDASTVQATTAEKQPCETAEKSVKKAKKPCKPVKKSVEKQTLKQKRAAEEKALEVKSGLKFVDEKARKDFHRRYKAGVRLQVLQVYSKNGCPKCRWQKRGCTDSCYRYRGQLV